MEFNRCFLFIFYECLEEALKPPIKPIKVPLMVWLGMPGGLDDATDSESSSGYRGIHTRRRDV